MQTKDRTTTATTRYICEGCAENLEADLGAACRRDACDECGDTSAWPIHKVLWEPSPELVAFNAGVDLLCKAMRAIPAAKGSPKDESAVETMLRTAAELIDTIPRPAGGARRRSTRQLRAVRG